MLMWSKNIDRTRTYSIKLDVQASLETTWSVSRIIVSNVMYV